MWAALREFGRDLPGEVRVVVVCSEGRAFSAGLDVGGGQDSPSASAAGSGSAPGPAGQAPLLAQLATAEPQWAEQRIAEFQEAFSWLRRPDLITVAAVQGYAIGAGFQLALACDLRVLADDAQLCMAEVKLGLVPDLGGTKRIVELVGYARALEICATGRRVSAAEAERIGLANLVVGRAELDAAVADLTAAILSANRDAVVEIKALLAGAAGRSFAEQEAAERAAQLRRIRDLAGIGE